MDGRVADTVAVTGVMRVGETWSARTATAVRAGGSDTRAGGNCRKRECPPLAATLSRKRRNGDSARRLGDGARALDTHRADRRRRAASRAAPAAVASAAVVGSGMATTAMSCTDRPNGRPVIRPAGVAAPVARFTV